MKRPLCDPELDDYHSVNSWHPTRLCRVVHQFHYHASLGVLWRSPSWASTTCTPNLSALGTRLPAALCIYGVILLMEVAVFGFVRFEVSDPVSNLRLKGT